jgi:microcystin-dependent protein
MGTTYGAGDGSTTFNIPDLRGYLLAGKDDMNGSAANRITSGGSGIAGTTLGAAGGAETVTLSTGQIPSHGHGVSDPTHSHGVNDPTHSHGITDPGHNHVFQSPLIGGAGTFAGGGSNFGGNAGDSTATTGISINAAATGISLGGAATGIAIQAAGGGGAHQNMPPTRICNFIMRIL